MTQQIDLFTSLTIVMWKYKENYILLKNLHRRLEMCFKN